MQTCSQGPLPGAELQPGHHLAKLSRCEGGWGWSFLFGGGGAAFQIASHYMPFKARRMSQDLLPCSPQIFISFFGSFFNCSPQMLSIFILLFSAHKKEGK